VFTPIEHPDAGAGPGTFASGINDRGQIVGFYIDADGRGHGFLWDKGRFTPIDVPGAAASTATDINNRGQIVGEYGDDPFVPTALHGFLLSGGDFTTFDAPAVPFSTPTSINNAGQIAGFTSTGPVLPQAEVHGFLLARGVMGPFTPIDFPGTQRTLAWGLNDRGQIVGLYENPDAGPDGQPSPMRMPMMKMVMSGL
jgi:probable HAF family extracellular repeat protein